MTSARWLASPAGPPGRVRPVVVESWRRARASGLDPERLLPAVELAEDDVSAYRDGHPLAALMPVIRKLLVREAEGSGLLVAVGDAGGRLLWVEGDGDARRRAERMLFVAGANWAEDRVGTSAPGTALALDHAIQIHDTEHFDYAVHGWSCTAVPVHDPQTRRVLGVIDLTGDERAVGPLTMPLLEATATAVESQLLARRLARGTRPAPGARPAPGPAVLRVLGRDTGELVIDGAATELSLRHATLITLLAWHREGLPAEALRELAYGPRSADVTLRAELVRLRRVLSGTGLAIESHPYRLSRPVELDAHQVLGLLDRGAHRRALAAYPGPALPGSDAPGVAEIREALRLRLRDALLDSASADVLLAYAATGEGAQDAGVLREALRLLPAHSPKRATVVERLEALEN